MRLEEIKAWADELQYEFNHSGDQKLGRVLERLVAVAEIATKISNTWEAATSKLDLSGFELDELQQTLAAFEADE